MKYVIVCFAAVMLCGADIYVAENGNDDAPGAKEKPFRTITRARDAAREKRNEAVTIYLRGGTYFLDSAVVFTAEDSGTQSTPRVYTSAPGERAVVYGGRRIQGWSAMGGGVYTASVEPGWVFHQMEENGIAARKARHPNTGYLIVEAGIPQRDKNGAVVQDTLWGIRHSQKEFVYKDGDIPWDIPQAEVFIWAGFDWFGNLIPVKSMDREKRILALARTTLVPIVIRKERRYYLQNVREALDVPGEFYLDAAAGKLFYKPMKEPIDRQLIIAARTTRILSFVGTSNEHVAHITVRGIDLSLSDYSNCFVETEGTHGLGVWNEPLNKDGAVYFENASECAVEHCRIANAGYSGAAFVWGAVSNRVYGCEIASPGFHGVLLSGYRAKFGTAFDMNKYNIIENNWIHHVGREAGHGAGVFIWASGHNRITHNVMHDSPRYGICIKGEGMSDDKTANWAGNIVGPHDRYPYVHSRYNYLAYNDIFRVSTDTEDNGFISYWHPGESNIAYNNLLHDSKRELGGLGMAVYLDDGADYCRLENNIIYNVLGGTERFGIFNKGRYNATVNNIIVCDADTKAAMHMWEGYGHRVAFHEYSRNIIVTKGTAAAFHFQLAGWDKERITGMGSNVYFNPDDNYDFIGYPPGLSSSIDEWRPASGLDASSVITDPLFVHAAKHDYRLAKNSPAHALGFARIEVEKIGLLADSRFREEQRSIQRSLGCMPDYSGDVSAVRTAAAYTHVPKRSAFAALGDYFAASGVSKVLTAGGVKLFAEKQTSIAVSGEAPFDDGSCLKMTDGEGPTFDPRIMFNMKENSGTITFSFAVRIPEVSPAVTIDAREYANDDGSGSFKTFSSMRIAPDGTVTSGKTALGTIPRNVWVPCSMVYSLGANAGTSYHLMIKGVFDGDIAKTDAAARKMHRIIIYSEGQTEGIFYLDALNIEKRK
ncbi:MAG: right-handed parallel beta-helix repeat-containing protein [Spirochaetota bacterium]